VLNLINDIDKLGLIGYLLLELNKKENISIHKIAFCVLKYKRKSIRDW